MFRFIRPLFILAPHDSNIAFYAPAILFTVSHIVQCESLFDFAHISDFVAALASRWKN